MIAKILNGIAPFLYGSVSGILLRGIIDHKIAQGAMWFAFVSIVLLFVNRMVCGHYKEP